MIVFCLIFKQNINLLNIIIILTILNIISLFIYEQKISSIQQKSHLLERCFNSSSFVVAIINKNGTIVFKNDLFNLLYQNKNINNLVDIIDYFNEYPEVKNAIQKGISACLLEKVFNFDINIANKKYRLYMNNYNLANQQYTVFCIYDLSSIVENENIDKIISYLLNHINVGMILTDRSGKIIFTNNLANNMMKMGLNGKNIKSINNLASLTPSVKTKLNVSHGFYINITMQKYFSDYYFYKLEQEEFKINLQLEEAPFGVIVLDLKLNIFSINKYLMRYISHTKFNNIKELVADFQSEQFIEYLVQFTNGKEPNPSYFKLLSKDGPQIMIYVKNIKNEYLVVYCIDDKFMKDHHGQFMHQQRLNSLGEVVCGVSHDFNNIITTILGLSDMILERNALPPNSSDYIDLTRIKHSACKAANLIKQMLNISRKQTLNNEILDVNEIINEFLSTIGRLFEENIEIIFYKNKNIPFIYMNEVYLEQILINLIKNAKDAMKYGGNITIRTDLITFNKSFIENGTHVSSGTYVEIIIHDTGSGISRENIKNIFSPFFSDKGNKGNGMGLSNVLSIIQQSNGFIKVKSKINIGSTFYIYLPHYEKPKMDKIDKIDKKPIILIVEDEESIRQFTTNGLNRKGYYVISTSDPEEALNLMDENVYLVILDIMLPKMSGHDLYKHLKKKNNNMQVIFISGYSEEKLHYQNQQNIHWLPKPFSFKELCSIVRAVVGEPKQIININL